ncbi:hypothetical protein FQA47_012019 [Oryzias melastigma]|uniref:Uncharacterized protein n=1 Tax=Oryzias melastigma TaxID=30732 RepID=A0A834CCY9_ORYME|nr:hypothetical protein FQA47_012019 [Oryzias melastigma]
MRQRESSPPGSVFTNKRRWLTANERRQSSGAERGEGDKSSPEEADERVDEGRPRLSEVAALLFGVPCARDRPRGGLADADSLVSSSCVSHFINR